MQGLARLVLCFIARDTNLCWQNKWDSGVGWRNKYWYCKSNIFMSFISILKYPKNIGIKIMVLKIKIKNLKKIKNQELKIPEVGYDGVQYRRVDPVKFWFIDKKKSKFGRDQKT